MNLKKSLNYFYITYLQLLKKTIAKYIKLPPIIQRIFGIHRNWNFPLTSAFRLEPGILQFQKRFPERMQITRPRHSTTPISIKTNTHNNRSITRVQSFGRRKHKAPNSIGHYQRWPRTSRFPLPGTTPIPSGDSPARKKDEHTHKTKL